MRQLLSSLLMHLLHRCCKLSHLLNQPLLSIQMLYQNDTFQFYSELFTYCSFLFFGFFGFLPQQEKSDNSKSSILEKITSSKLNYIFIIAFSIMIGELGDKTFLASLGLGLQYPNYRISLIFGVQIFIQKRFFKYLNTLSV